VVAIPIWFVKKVIFIDMYHTNNWIIWDNDFQGFIGDLPILSSNYDVTLRPILVMGYNASKFPLDIRVLMFSYVL
jgi:hypothetical protein